jgi:oxygen-independent coproporphyrinogen-3 oxidase
VLRGLRALFDLSDDVEVTVECNPTSLDEHIASDLADAGVTRLSVGTQSLREDQLRFLGRLHDPEGAVRAVTAARSTGLRVSTDVIFGLPDQPVDDAVEQVRTLASLGLEHLSCYQLTIEAGTRFGELARRGRLPRADDGAVAEAFLAIDVELESHGLAHYEISNYARPGQESRHNVGYWTGLEYVGLGCGAYGFVRGDTDGRASGTRYRNDVQPDRYIEKTTRLRPAICEDDGLTESCETLDALILLRERIMLGLRLRDGFDLTKAGQELGLDPWTSERTRTIEWLEARGRLLRRGSNLVLPKEQWLFADDTAARLF